MPAVERVKLRMKIGVHEFEAEGPRDLVIAQVATRMRVAGLGTTPVNDPASAATDRTRGASSGEGAHAAMQNLFRVDAERQLITLRVRVNGRRRNADAALLLLYGFDTCLGAGDGAATPAVRLRAALAASGYRVRRVDRALGRYVLAGLVCKAGRHKHETYSLTAPGTRHAAVLARQLAPASDPHETATTPVDVAGAHPKPAMTTAGMNR